MRAVQGRHPLLSHAMHTDQRLLRHRLHRHARDLTRPDRFEQRGRIGAIGLVTAHVRTNIARGQQGHRVPVLLRHAAPVVRGPTRLHHHVRRRLLREESRKLPSVQALARDDVPLRVRGGELEDGFCEVNGHCRSIHLGLLLVTLMGVS